MISNMLDTMNLGHRFHFLFIFSLSLSFSGGFRQFPDTHSSCRLILAVAPSHPPLSSSPPPLLNPQLNYHRGTFFAIIEEVNDGRRRKTRD